VPPDEFWFSLVNSANATANLYQLMEQQTETTLHLNVVMITPEQT
jgi:hypothetical protein